MEGNFTARVRLGSDSGEPMLFCEVKFGKRYVPIARRPAGQRWISLEPGWTVCGGEPGNYDRMSIEFAPVVEVH
jgi:hypothetical protein